MSKNQQQKFLSKKNEKPEDAFSIISFTGEDSQSVCYIAISPDGQQIVTFNPESCEFTLYDIGDFNKPTVKFLSEEIVHDKRYCYSLAISNCVDHDGERFIALSCFGASEMLYDQNENTNKIYDEKDENNLMEVGENVNLLEIKSHTWVISTTHKNEIHTSLESIGGVIRFLDSDVKILESQPLIDKTVIIIVNASGIYKQTLNSNRIMMKQEFQKLNRFLKSSSTNIEQFELPQQLSISLSRLDHGKNALELLHTSIIKNHFMVHSFKNQQQIIEMYSLITGDLEMLFKRHESSAAPNVIRGSSIFSISQNEGILAFCRGTIGITLFLMENGLEITTKQLVGDRGRTYKIVAIEFIDNDSKLLIVLEEEIENSSGEISIQQKFIVWDLFTTFKDSIRQIDYSESQEPLKMDATHRLINSHGNMLVVTDSGKIISILDHEDVNLIRNPPSKKMTEIEIFKENEDVYHAIYDINGKISDDESKDLIIQNVEPWQPKHYFRSSVWLDSTKRTQLIISRNTVQIWKYRACRSLYVLGEKKQDVSGPKNINRIDYLIECTQRLVRKYITKYGIFRLTDIRYSIMKYLIKGYQENLIKQILNKKINGKNNLDNAILCTRHGVDFTAILKYLIDYYADNAKEYNNDGWMFTVTKAIPLLYDYQLNGFVLNLFKKPCFGATEAYTPPLYISHRDQKKGNKVAKIHALILKPRLASKHSVTPLEKLRFSKRIKEIIPLEEHQQIITSYNDRKVYKVPLPDFTVYPEVLKDHEEGYLWLLFTLFRIFWLPRKNVVPDKKESPFIRIIREEESTEIYQTPAIMAVSAFKWSSARRHYIRHIILYVIFAITYTITVISYSFTGEPTELFKSDSAAVIKSISLFFYGYTGWYLIATEIVQLKRAGWYKYISIYSFFDIASVLLPFAVSMASILNDFDVINLKYSVYNTVLAFTALVLWLEVVDEKSLQRPTYQINDTSGLYPNISVTQVIDQSSYLDNYYSHILSSLSAVYFWTNGRWDQLDQWDSYSIIIMSMLGSIILVLIFQNMLIAFMNGAFESSNIAGRAAVHKYRAELIAEYDILEKPFGNRKGNPRYIYYIPNPDLIDDWLEGTKKDNGKQRSHNSSHLNKDKRVSRVSSDNKDTSEPDEVDEIRFTDEEIKS
ncbi:8759_t:CDS:10 [Diversispora eburnea]|uniref:8759_t:CDS:1 n=1 Tax=Diversispora eburnea TaxID=1213867 RepID=A0A9N8WEU7_9GLOM|nr:8759_t:CDS:10 [Diversispora eburnea]